MIVEHVSTHTHCPPPPTTNLLVKSMPLFKYKGHVDTPRQLDDGRIGEYHQEKHNRLFHLNQFTTHDTINQGGNKERSGYLMSRVIAKVFSNIPSSVPSQRQNTQNYYSLQHRATLSLNILQGVLMSVTYQKFNLFKEIMKQGKGALVQLVFT